MKNREIYVPKRKGLGGGDITGNKQVKQESKANVR